ncbi:sensor histidine kinase [Terrimonas sp. NA20]|uniref:Sensor histidine kinase n=1 Tax=Terrimonas ginsenosidimutans TaxID=2908004 RepID=A0ABS9KP73_9BACT|nr:sensor histidine kinase [Terrimonas ginsenosidimutans]MCG2614134.1 sensor histidine kinase [Terrimonas ginsenosidimutans]
MKQKFTPVVAHVAAWLLFFSLVLGFAIRMPNSGGDTTSRVFSVPFLIFSSVFLFLFYANYFLLFPRLYLRKKYFLYIAIGLVLFTGVYTLRPFEKVIRGLSPREQGHRPQMREGEEQRRFMSGPRDSLYAPPQGGPREGRRPPGMSNREHPTDIVSIILFVTVWSLSTAICVIREWKRTESRVMQAEADKANAELSFLKAQINPHFLFNTLNNIYSLAVTKNENTAESIMKLSNIMRYVTDDVTEDYVSLENEIECLRDYIDLQRLRLGKKMTVSFIVEGQAAGKKIAPLILMNFIENVFKYGISSHEESVIEIKLSAQDDHIRFFCRNRLFEAKTSSDRAGIGVKNTRQRLQRLYPDRHFLNITTDDGFYTVQLTLQV